LDNRGKNRFLSDLQAFQHRVAYFGRVNTLAQVLLKLTSPGVPDIYQGTEIWDFSLVDPDNRQPVDYERRRLLLNDLKTQVARAGQDLIPLVQRLLDHSLDGRIKLYLIFRTLNFRRAHQPLFSRGTYLPLEAVGEKKDHLCAFARILGDEGMIVVNPRLVVGLTGGVNQPPLGERVWKDTWLILPPEWGDHVYRNLFTGESLPPKKNGQVLGLPLMEVLNNFPVGLFERIG